MPGTSLGTYITTLNKIYSGIALILAYHLVTKIFAYIVCLFLQVLERVLWKHLTETTNLGCVYVCACVCTYINKIWGEREYPSRGITIMREFLSLV